MEEKSKSFNDCTQQITVLKEESQKLKTSLVKCLEQKSNEVQIIEKKLFDATLIDEKIKHLTERFLDCTSKGEKLGFICLKPVSLL